MVRKAAEGIYSQTRDMANGQLKQPLKCLLCVFEQQIASSELNIHGKMGERRWRLNVMSFFGLMVIKCHAPRERERDPPSNYAQCKTGESKCWRMKEQEREIGEC